MATATETAMADTKAPVQYRDPRSYVAPEVWDREIQLLMRDYPFDEVMATRRPLQAGRELPLICRKRSGPGA